MGQAMLRVGDLPPAPLDAAARFHGEWLVKARNALADAEALVLVFPAASYEHRGWRLAAVQDLAREAAPRRVNGLVGDDERMVAETGAWLDRAPAITGQLLAVDGNSGAKG